MSSQGPMNTRQTNKAGACERLEVSDSRRSKTVVSVIAKRGDCDRAMSSASALQACDGVSPDQSRTCTEAKSGHSWAPARLAAKDRPSAGASMVRRT